MKRYFLVCMAALLCLVLLTPIQAEEADIVEALLAQMTPYERVCQLFVVKPESIISAKHVTRAGEATRQAMKKYPVGGFVYFSGNITSEKQITQMIDTVQTYAKEAYGIGAFIGIDEEGGQIIRAAKKLPKMTRFDTMQDIGARGDTLEAYALGQTLAQELIPLGFTNNFAPVADVLVAKSNAEIGVRSFGRDAQNVAAMVAAEVKGMQEGGITACLKHFPGMGSTVSNSHLGTSVSERTLDELRKTELVPFRAGIEAGAPMVMVSHMTLLEVDKDFPCSLSRKIVTGLLREELGFDGLIITDALRMQAISDHYKSAEAAVLAIEAGVDLLLMPADARLAIEGVYAAVESGRLSQERIDESVRRILTQKVRQGLIAGGEE